MAQGIYRAISSSDALRVLLEKAPPSTHVPQKIHVVAILAGHLLFMRVAVDCYPDYASPLEYSMLFNAMSDESKRLLNAEGYPNTSPVLAFENLATRSRIIPVFRGESALFSEEPIIESGSLFGMMLTAYMKDFLEMFPSNGIPVAKISPLTVERISGILAAFMITAVSETTDAPPPEIRTEFFLLGAFICGVVNAEIKASPIR